MEYILVVVRCGDGDKRCYKHAMNVVSYLHPSNNGSGTGTYNCLPVVAIDSLLFCERESNDKDGDYEGTRKVEQYPRFLQLHVLKELGSIVHDSKPGQCLQYQHIYHSCLPHSLEINKSLEAACLLTVPRG